MLKDQKRELYSFLKYKPRWGHFLTSGPLLFELGMTFLSSQILLFGLFALCADKIQGLVSSSMLTNSVFGYPRATIIYLERKTAYAMSCAKTVSSNVQKVI